MSVSVLAIWEDIHTISGVPFCRSEFIREGPDGYDARLAREADDVVYLTERIGSFAGKPRQQVIGRCRNQPHT